MLLTHGHQDHVGDVQLLRASYPEAAREQREGKRAGGGAQAARPEAQAFAEKAKERNLTAVLKASLHIYI